MKENFKMLKKINQAGSMMIEALAMLTLISLVTPTLYKKSAERTNELQDINTATHVRTVMKAADNFATVNYKEILDEMQKGGKNILEIANDGDFKNYLPYGYKFDKIKNFDAPKIYIVKGGDAEDANASLTTFVVFDAVNQMPSTRSSRIASMIGANGGYIDDEGKANGVGGVWSLNKSDLKALLGLSDDKEPVAGSIISASTEAINEATRSSQENTKYLQRTDAGNESRWKNTMATNLYMGGVEDLSGTNMEMKGIYGVNQMIIGSVETPANVGLMVSGSNPNTFIEGTLEALDGEFSVTDNELKFKDIIDAKRTGNPEDGFVDNFTVGDGLLVVDSNEGATLNVDTKVTEDSTFTTEGDTNLATGADKTLKVGDEGQIMTASANNIKMIGTGEEAKLSLTDTDLTVKTDTAQLTGKVTIGTKDQNEDDSFNEPVDHKVYGDAMFNDTVYANRLKTHQFDTETLHAGGAQNSEDRWLHADDTGVYINKTDLNQTDDENNWTIDPLMKANADGVEFNVANTGHDAKFEVNVENNEEETTARIYIDDEVTGIYGKQGYEIVNGTRRSDAALEFGDTNVDLHGLDQTDINTANSEGQVNIQEGALVLNARKGMTYGDGYGNDITANADRFTVQTNGSKLLDIASNANKQVLDGDSTVEIDPTTFKVWANGSDKKNILKVDASDFSEEKDDDEDSPSVYIRRGAIEVEESSPVEEGPRYKADQGLGYIEASRFVANNKDADGYTIIPVYSGEYGSDRYNAYGGNPDRYMVNPAYTSVMHDIKLTTRGGARLSDILPDFINKGIYIVNNSYTESGIGDFKGLTVTDGGRFASDKDASATATNGSEWASPYLGMVPAPLCPPGHARVITLTPAGFQMAQAGDLIYDNGRYFVQENNQANSLTSSTGDQITSPEMQNIQAQVPGSGGYETRNIYYLGMAPQNGSGQTYDEGNTPKPLYFQQSTWLKGKVLPFESGNGMCGGNSGGSGCSNFGGWAAIMGFIYPAGDYNNLVSYLGSDQQDGDVYWNVFPVRAYSLEAYATVYCYFDRTNLFDSSHNDGEYVEQYDQMNNFRTSYDKQGRKNGHGSGAATTNPDYVERLNDPHLKYTNPW